MRTLFLLLITGLLVANPAFAKKNKGELPPGLQKKVQRGGELPPGWKKKVAKGKILDRQIYDQGKVVTKANSLGIITIKVDDRLIKLHKDTRKILDVVFH